MVKRKWMTIESMPINAMRDILKAFGQTGVSDLDREELSDRLLELIKNNSIRGD